MQRKVYAALQRLVDSDSHGAGGRHVETAKQGPPTMCLTSEAFGLFLSIISLSHVTVEEDLVTIHTPDRDVEWHATGSDVWCTPAGSDLFAINDQPLVMG